MKLWKRFLDFVFPPKCVFCRKVLAAEGVCEDCAVKLPYRPVPLVKDKISFVDSCYSPLYYEASVRNAILRYKFGGLQCYAVEFGKILAKCIEENLNGEFDLVTWVPVSKRRLHKRGYDQSRLLAEETCKLLWLEPKKLLIKGREAAPQSRQPTRESRAANILGAFSAADVDLKGKSVLIIDDIATTGSTLSECARVLKTAGAEKVYGVILAKTQLFQKKN